jgi:hypothetical protein
MRHTFLGLPFESLDLSQRAFLAAFLDLHPQPLSGYTFATLATWDPFFEYFWSFPENGTILISCLLMPDKRRHFMQPLGIFSEALQESLIREALTLPYPLRIVGVSEEFLVQAAGFVKYFNVVEDAAAANYIYRTEHLSRLPGRKYAKKRNLISQAQSLYTWTTEPLTDASIDSCFDVLRRIQEEENPAVDANLELELASLNRTLQFWSELRQQGILLKVWGEPAAFSIFEAINPQSVAVHFERALRCYKGLYQVINCETARVIEEQGFEFINREEDLGSPGLRDAKRSYAPIQLLPAFELTLK